MCVCVCVCGCVCFKTFSEMHVVHSTRHATHTPFHDMLPHNCIINNDIISPNVLT